MNFFSILLKVRTRNNNFKDANHKQQLILKIRQLIIILTQRKPVIFLNQKLLTFQKPCRNKWD